MATGGASDDRARLQELASAIDCLTEEDLALLVGVKLETLEAWRKRGKGPEYALVGSRFLYPRSAVARHVADRVRSRPAQPASGLI